MKRIKRTAAQQFRNRTNVSEIAGERTWLRLLVPLAVAVATFVVFFPALFNEFVNWDDDIMVLDNPHFRGLGLAQLRWMFSTFHGGHFQPLSWITLGFDYVVWGVNPFGYHLTSLILHASNAVIFYFLCRLLFTVVFARVHRDTSLELDLSAAVAAILFALHPLRVESVAWATERRDVLSGGFFLAAIYCYLRANALTGPAMKLRNRWYWLALAAQLFSLMAKATAITLPLVLILLDIYPLARLSGKLRTWAAADPRRVLWEKLPFLLLSVIFGVVALFAQHAAGALRPVHQYFLSYRLGQGFYGICYYFWKTLWPTQLSPLYELPFDFAQWASLFIACAVITTLASLLVILLRWRWPWAAACWVYYVIVLAPVLGVAQSGPQLVADRYSYLSCLSWAALTGGIFYHWMQGSGQNSNRARAITAVAVILVSSVGLGLLTRAQVGFWHDSETLWKHALRITPNTAIAAYNLGKVYETSGSSQESVDLYRRAVSINPTYADAHYNLARLLAQQGKRDEAIGHYREALKFKPNDAETHNNLGQLLTAKGDVDGALAEYWQALALDPQFAKVYFNLGRLYVHDGELPKAIENFQQALKLAPAAAEVHAALGDAYVRLGNIDNAVFYFDAAVKLKPEMVDVQLALARLLARQGKKGEAERHYQAALGGLEARTQDRSSP